MELSVRRWNARSAERGKILLLHGMGGTGSLWRPIAATLEDHYSVLAPDQRGHGESRVSSKERDFTPLAYAQDVVDTLQRETFHPTWVIGHSMGVRTAVALAHLKPEWVQGLVLIDLGFYGPAGGGLGETLAKFIQILPQGFDTRAQARQFMNDHCPDPSIAQYLMAVAIMTPKGSAQEVVFPFDHSALIQTIKAAETLSIREWIRDAASRMPILVLRGANSAVWLQSEFLSEKERFKDLPRIQFEEFPDTGHGLPFEKRKEFLARVLHLIEDKT